MMIDFNDNKLFFLWNKLYNRKIIIVNVCRGLCVNIGLFVDSFLVFIVVVGS